MPAPWNGRSAALACILLSRRLGMPAAEMLPGICARARLSPAERGLARELAGGAVRHAVSMDLAIAAASRRPVDSLDEPLREVLRQGAYQILFLERIPHRAAVDESVKLAKAFCGKSTGALANAVLRKLIRMLEVVPAGGFPAAGDERSAGGMGRRAGEGTGGAHRRRMGRDAPQAPAAAPGDADGEAAPIPAASADSSRGAIIAGRRPRNALYFRGGRSARLKKPVLPAFESDAIGWLGGFYGFPRQAVEILVAALGAEDAEKVLRASNEIPPVTVRLNRTRMPAAGGLAAPAPDEGSAGVPADFLSEAFEGVRSFEPVDEEGRSEGLYRIEFSGDIGSLPGYKKGLWTVQDAWAAQTVIRLELPDVSGPEGPFVVDLCAAPGGKATAMAERVACCGGRVLACDSDARRLEMVAGHAKRLGLANLSTRVMDGRRPPDDLRCAADIVLVDAPCTNLAVMARRWEVRQRISRDAVAAMAGLQGELLDGAALILKPRGIILYSTCTLTCEENSGAAASFLERHRDFRIIREETKLPEGGTHDGGYVCALERIE